MDSKLDQICALVEDHGQRISNSNLAAKVSDLEGSSWRSNLRILGLPESTESGCPSVMLLMHNVGAP